MDAKPSPGSAAMPKLTKADTVALWHAVDAMRWQLRGLQDLQDFDDPERQAKLVAHEREQLAAAGRALRKVNAIRKAGG